MTPNIWKSEWDAFLGKEKDSVLARRFGVHKGTVAYHRRRLGIRRFLIDRTGMRFGKWTIGERVIGKGYMPVYSCRCDCGTVADVTFSNLFSGRTTQCRSCGYNQRTTRVAGSVVGSKTILSVVRNGGGRRFRVRCACGNTYYTAKPRNSQHCSKCAPTPGMAPDTSAGLFFEVNGERHNLAGWAKKAGLSRQALHARLRNGWPLEKAIATPKIGGAT